MEELYTQWRSDPDSVDPSWRHFFQGMEFALERPEKRALEAPSDLRVQFLIDNYRTYGHLLVQMNPIDPHPVTEVFELRLDVLGFAEEELDTPFPTCGLMEVEEAPLREIIEVLRETYCGRIGVEFKGCQRPEMEAWLQEQIEPTRMDPNLTLEQKRRILNYLNHAELFEIFLNTKYVGQKRFSLEGGDALIPVIQAIIGRGAERGMEEFVIGMPHRGRLNVLVNILNKSYANVFHEFEDTIIEDSFDLAGDVKYHKGFSADVETADGHKVHLSLTANPSHLESVDPVVEGQTRAKQVLKGDDLEKKRIVPILMHGDAALAGQGVIYETMQMCNLSGYGVGGTIHLVVNNQIGYTTLPKDSRSTRYCTDIARAFSAPVFHVNGEDPEACVYAALLAVELRQKFGCDVFIDINCYRKYGHNEGDEPAFTQPLEYLMIRAKKSPREIYRDALISQGVIEKQMAEELEAEFKAGLQAELDQVQTLETKPSTEQATPRWQAVREANLRHNPFEPVETAVSEDKMVALAEKFCQIPEGFNLHRKVAKLAADRLKMVHGEPLNWGMAEHLAFATLLAEGTHVRLAGQDSRRGTFNHRHAMWMDQKEEGKYFPLNHVGEGRFDVFNSHLSEFAALAFEYGYSLSYPEALVAWEAQFGDFANGAQVVFDQYLSTSEQKWHRLSGLVLLLPHGYEGQGPEHSSGRIERSLQLAGDNNMYVCNPTTPAQIFHLLRRQVLQAVRRPLIVFTPKQLFGHPGCVSALSELSSGHFQEIIPDDHSDATRVLFCSGRLYYDLVAEQPDHVAIVRIEQLYPFHEALAREVIGRYPKCKEWIWIQEEPENMGAWDFLRPILREVLPNREEARYIGRRRSASPATGSPSKHKAQQAEILKQAFE